MTSLHCTNVESLLLQARLDLGNNTRDVQSNIFATQLDGMCPLVRSIRMPKLWDRGLTTIN